LDVPTLGLFEARCLDKLGRLVEANERYLAVTRIQLDEKALEVHRTAQTEAATERAALQPRIPKLEIVVIQAPNAQLTLDGRPVPAALVGVTQPVDPGTHNVVAVARGKTMERRIEVKEGATARAEFDFTGSATTAPVLTQPPASGSVDAAQGAPERDKSTGQGQRTAGYIALGVGGVGLVVGGVVGVLALGKKGDLDDNCTDSKCGPDYHGDVDSYDTLRLLSTIGFGVGIAGAATGAVLLLTAPSESGVTASVSPSGIRVGGRF